MRNNFFLYLAIVDDKILINNAKKIIRAFVKYYTCSH